MKPRITKSVEVASPPIHRPLTFRLPQRGGDPYFGLTKAHWYIANKQGHVEFVKIIQPGKTRGITLVDYASAERYVRQAMR